MESSVVIVLGAAGRGRRQEGKRGRRPRSKQQNISLPVTSLPVIVKPRFLAQQRSRRKKSSGVGGCNDEGDEDNEDDDVMGSLTGHVVPGTFFGIFALWWAVDIMIRYFENHFLGKNHHGILRLRPDPQRKTSPTSWGSPLLPPFETSLRFMSVLIGIAGEYVTALDGEGNFRAIHNGQHITMFTFFLLPTLFDIMHFYNVSNTPCMSIVSTQYTRP